MRAAILLVAALVAAVPFASSEGAYSGDHAIDVIFGTPAAADGHTFFVEAAAGDTISVALRWTSSRADLDLDVVSPDAPSCAVFPGPDAPCLARSLGDTDALCERDPAPLALGPGHVERTLVATATGTHEVILRATAAAPGLAFYHIDIHVAGAGGAVYGPEAAVFLGGNAACKLP